MSYGYTGVGAGKRLAYSINQIFHSRSVAYKAMRLGGFCADDRNHLYTGALSRFENMRA